jgi:hypothetical protein
MNEPQHLMRRIVGIPYISTNLQNTQHTGCFFVNQTFLA